MKVWAGVLDRSNRSSFEKEDLREQVKLVLIHAGFRGCCTSSSEPRLTPRYC